MPNTTESETLEILSSLVHEYKQKHHKIEPLSPIEALKYKMKQQGLTQTGLAKRFGISQSSISEIINEKKQMSVKLMKYFHHDLGISAKALLAK
jgi:HTH-type transcriptional regulator / antitoxin HigA